MSTKSYRMALLVLVFFVFAAQICLSQEDPVIVLADGGGFVEEPLAPNSFWYLALSVWCQNAKGVSFIRGEVTHPYGEGPFEIGLAPSDIVESASISIFPDQIHFKVRITPAIPKELTQIFSATPVTQDEYIFGRPNTKFESYPYRISWLSLEVMDDEGRSVPFSAKTDPVMISWDVGHAAKIYTEGFHAEIVSVGLYSLNGVLCYPTGLPKYKDYYYGLEFLKGISYLPVTLEVVLRDGSRFLFEYPDGLPANPTLRPPSSVRGWEDHHR